MPGLNMYQILYLLALLPVIDCKLRAFAAGRPYGRKNSSCNNGFLSGVDTIKGFAIMDATSWNFTSTLEIKRESVSCWEKVCVYNMADCPQSNKERCYCQKHTALTQSVLYNLLADEQFQNATLRFTYEDGAVTRYSNTRKMPNIVKKVQESLHQDFEPISIREPCILDMTAERSVYLWYCVRNLQRPYRVNLTILDQNSSVQWTDSSASSPCVDTRIQICHFDTAMPLKFKVSFKHQIVFSFEEDTACGRRRILTCSLKQIEFYPHRSLCAMMMIGINWKNDAPFNVNEESELNMEASRVLEDPVGDALTPLFIGTIISAILSVTAILILHYLAKSRAAIKASLLEQNQEERVQKDKTDSDDVSSQLDPVESSSNQKIDPLSF